MVPEGKDLLCLGCVERLTRGLALGTGLDRWCVKCAHPGEAREPVAVMAAAVCAIPSEAGGQAGDEGAASSAVGEPTSYCITRTVSPASSL